MKYFIFLSFLIIHFLSFSQGNRSKQVEIKINELLQKSDYKNASIGFLAVNTSNNDTLVSFNKNLSLTPASITKVITTATALELFGYYKTFKTDLYYTGSIIEGILQGDIVIKGFGDPVLGSRFFEEHYGDFVNKWVQVIKEKGIKKIEGKIIADISYFSSNNVPDGWNWGDIGNYYGAAPLALNVYDNEFTVTFKTGSSDGDSTKVVSITPEIPYMNFINQVKTGNVSGDQSMIYGSLNDISRLATGMLPRNKSEFDVRGSTPQPPLLLGLQLKDSLIVNNISIDSVEIKTLNDTTQLFLLNSIPSVALSEIITKTNMYSINLFAEVLFNQIGISQKTDPSSAIKSFWKNKIDVSGFFIEDGSGLSRSNAFTPSNFVGLLTYMSKSKNFDTFYKSLPIAGKSGTLSGMFKGTKAENNLRAKSGSINRVRCYTGYFTNNEGNIIAFAIMINNYACSSNQVKNDIEKLILAIM